MFKNWLKREHKCSATLEWTLNAPMIILLVGVTLFTFMILLAWINYNSLAGDIARDLNFRQTGQRVALAQVATKAPDGVYVHTRDSKGNEVKLTDDFIKVSVSDPTTRSKYKKCVGYHMMEHPNSWSMPYAPATALEVDLRRVNEDGTSWTDLNANNRLSNHLVRVNIKWNFLPVKLPGIQWNGITMNSTGYAVIT